MNRLSRIGLGVVVFLLAACMQSAPPQQTEKISTQAISNGVVISQVYGGGGNSGATLKNDFIELFNRGTTTVNLTGWSVQYASAAGTTWQRTNLSGSIQPGQYYLVQQAAGAGGTVNLPTPDATGNIPMSASTGKVALVSSQTTLSGGCPANVMDFVGFGGADCSETSPTPTLSNTTAALRKDNGCTETDNNATDFATGTPSPHNTASAQYFCGESAPTVSSISPANATDVAPSSNITLTFSEPVSLTDPWYTISCTLSGSHAASVSNVGNVYTLNPDSDFVDGDTCTVTVSAAQVSDTDALDPPDTMTADFTSSFSVVDVCVNPNIISIPAIQGPGLATSLNGQTLSTRGVVVGDYEGALPTLRGFYIQDSVGDGDPATSDGIFVFNNNNDTVSLGDKVWVRGTAAEFQNQTQINANTVVVCSSGNSISPVNVTFPVDSPDYLERYEGMLVRLPQTLYVTEHFQLGRFGQVVLSANDRLAQPTNVTTPGAAANALQAQNDLNRIILDDALQNQNPDPIVFGRGGQPLSASNTLRGGDTATGIVGVMTYTWAGNAASGNAYRVRPVNALGVGGSVNFQPTNPRPSSVPAVGGSLKVVGMNLLNFFNTFDGLPDTVDNCTNGVGGAATDCRGADTQVEFDRQWPKTVAAIVAMNPDVVGFNEIENDGYGPNSAIQFLVNKLNAATAPGTYAFINADANTAQVNALGTDAIKVGLIYKPSKVSPVGQTAVLNSTDFVNGGDSAPRNRASLLQAFQQDATSAIFLVNVNHLKSKGSACDAPDAGDGQGNCSTVRTNAANLLTAWQATNPTNTYLVDPDILMIGDYNSYAQEDPITAIKNAGFTNLIESRVGPDAYSYVFDGQWGYLDHALASSALNPQVSGVGDYHVNADEPSVLDYNTDFKTANLQSSLYAPDQFRISDHDPVVVGLNLNGPGAFFATPVANYPAINTANTGQVAPIKFSLKGYKGLNIFASGYPKWELNLSCNPTAVLNGTTSANSAGALNYDSLLDQYTFSWKTDKKWENTCVQLVVRFADATTYRLNYRFVK